MARNLVTIEQVVNDFMLGTSEDDYASNVPDYHLRNLALRGARELGFDIMRRIKSVTLQVNSTLNTVELPDDFVDYKKIGEVQNGLVYTYKENDNINMAMTYCLDADGNPVDSDGDGVYERVDAKTVGESPTGIIADDFINARYLYDSIQGRWYGYGGAHARNEFRINYDQNRIELPSNNGAEEIIVEYIADAALETNPSIHVYTEEALRQYIYLKVIQRKANVPAVEKQRARAEYFNELRRANARLKKFTKDEALYTIRKNTKQSPKF